MRWQAIVLLTFHIMFAMCILLSKATTKEQQMARVGFICFNALAISLTISLGTT